MDSDKQRNKVYIEIIRIFACFFVIFNHSEGFGLYTSQEDTILFWCYSFISIFCKVSVPVFLAISGALLLPKKEGIIKAFKRAARILIVLILFSFFYYCFQVLLLHTEERFSFAIFIKKLYTSTTCGAYWYLYAYIAFMISLPLLSSIAEQLNNKQYQYLFGLAFFFYGCLPVIDLVLWKGDGNLNGDLRVYWLTHIIVMYPLLGYYLDNRIDINIITIKQIILNWIGNIATIFITIWATQYEYRIKGTYSQNFFNLFNMITIMNVYLTIKYTCAKIDMNNKIEKVIRNLGKATFGIYLLHLFCMSMPLFGHVHEIIMRIFSPMIGELLHSFIIMMASYCLTILVKKIPGIKKLLS